MPTSLQSDNKARSDGDADQEILLSMYEQHRQEIRAHGKRKSRRYLGSLTVLGIIVGYVFTTSGDVRILVLVPYVLGFLYLSHISSMHYVAQLAALLALIEAKMDQLGAEYELFHGGFRICQNPRFQNLESKYLDPSKSREQPYLERFDFWTNRTSLEQRSLGVSRYTRNAMRGIALAAYIVPMAIGSWLLYTSAVQITENSLFSMLPVSSGESLVFVLITQLVLLGVLVLAWMKYRAHKTVLRAGVLEAIDNDKFDAPIGLIDVPKLLNTDVYSVWLIPDQDTDVYQRLEATINKYAQQYEDAPVFEPHITVVGGIDGDESVLDDGVRSLAEQQDAFDVEFTGVQCSTTRHQCVFLQAVPTADLLSLHQEAVELFDVAAGMYVPHLSLVYSDMSIPERLELVESLTISSPPSTAHINSIALVKTTGSVSEWETVARYDL